MGSVEWLKRSFSSSDPASRSEVKQPKDEEQARDHDGIEYGVAQLDRDE